MSDPIKGTGNLKSGRSRSADSAAQVEKVHIDGDDISTSSLENKEATYSHLERQRNPYLAKSEQMVIAEANALVDQYDIGDLREEFVRGARLAYNREDMERLDPTPEETHWIEKETSTVFKDKWSQTWMMYYVAVLCGSAAIVQGMDQTAVNGAQL